MFASHHFLGRPCSMPGCRAEPLSWSHGTCTGLCTMALRTSPLAVDS
uniref:Uncharacterized protein n=1 Tax=Arundo donax TaxID=35708 RepID=A0A0A9DBU8_ARUDO